MNRKYLSWRDKIINILFIAKLTKKIQPWLGGLCLILIIISGWLIYNSPDDYKQGITVKIMFIHVPAAWLSLFCYSFLTINAFIYLVWRHTIAYLFFKSALPIGTIFTILTIITGSYWGKPTWGTWWVWDARLTSFFILLIIYLLLVTLQHSVKENSKLAIISSIFTIIGFVNIPIIKYSVDWWNSLHQGASVSIITGNQIENIFLKILLVSTITMQFLFFYFLIILLQNTILKQQIYTKKQLLLTKYDREN
ncbi:heme ABC transporter permease CcmC [Bartonella sp. DGB1]|uniref:heme ABC transporter permease CcmC n=1 Tax=Bartonella sp. DGB1 TaxID=3239807 RepID=UPI0035232CE8